MRNVARRSVLAGLAAAALGLSPGLSFAQSGEALTALARIKQDGFARVGFSNFTPWGYVADTGDLSGVEPTLVKAFLKSIGVEEMDGVLTQFVSMIPALEAQRFDFIAAGMQIRPARCEQIAFGDPEWKSTQAFLTRSGNPSKLTSLEHVVADPNIRLGVVGGGTEREYAAINGVPEAQTVVFPDLPTATAGLKAGRVDVLMFTSITARGLLAKQAHPEIEYVTMSKPPLDKSGAPVVGYGAIGFRKSDPELLAAWNGWLKQAKQSGELLELLQPFGFTGDDLATDDVTTGELCAPK